MAALAGRNGVPSSQEWRERLAVATLLYGQTDPDAVTAAGLHGLGGQLQPIRITISGRCRVTLTAPGGRETIDFTKITAIRHTVIADPAAAIARVVTPGGGDPRTLQLVILEGADDAICGPQGCTGRRIFALRDAERFAVAEAASATFRDHTCPAAPF